MFEVDGCSYWFHDNSSTDIFVYYCIPAYRTVVHPTSVSANHYFHQFQLLLTLCFLFLNPTSTDTMIIQHIYIVSKHCGMTIQLVLSVKDAYFLSIPLLVRKNSLH